MQLYRKRSGIRQLEEKITILEKEKNELLDKIKTLKSFEEFPAGDKEILNSVLKLTNIGFCLKLSDKNYLNISEIGCKILGLKQEERTITLNEFIGLVTPEDRPLINKLFTDSHTPAQTIVKDYRITNPLSEKETKSIVSVFSFKPLEGQVSFLFTLMDVTSQEKARKDILRLKDKLEESDRLKNAFLSNISHEIRVPINSIVGFAELLNIGHINPDQKKEYLSIIKNQSSNLLKLIDDIAELAKFEAGEVKISKSPCNLNLLLNELLVSFSQQKKSQKKDHLQLKISVPDKKGLVTYTDSGRLHQLLSNLVTNAINYTEKGSVEFGYVLKEDRKIEFFVKDTGVGLSKEEQRYIFDRFSKTEETITRKYEGSGLGLSIARGIAKLLGGKIWIDSEPGKGSVFSFNIPFEELPGNNHEQLIDEDSVIKEYNWKDRLLLVVEDNDVNYKFIDALLSENNAKVIRANNGYQAIELCKSINKIDLILMDIKMPEMDGFQATREIRKFNKSIPIIAQTAFSSEDDRQKCLDAGCNDKVSKPIDIEELLRKINEYFI